MSSSVDDLLDYVIERFGNNYVSNQKFSVNLAEISETDVMTRFKLFSIPHVILVIIRATDGTIRDFIRNRTVVFLNFLLLLFLTVDMKLEHSFVLEFISELLAAGACTLVIKCTCIISEPNRHFIPILAEKGKIMSYSIRDAPTNRLKSCILTSRNMGLSIEEYVSCLLYSFKIHPSDRADEKLEAILHIFEDTQVPIGVKSMVGAVLPGIDQILEHCNNITPDLIDRYLTFFDLSKKQIEYLRTEFSKVWLHTLASSDFKYAEYFSQSMER